MTDANTLASVLDALAGDCENTDGWTGAAPDCREAADLIRSQAEELERLRRALRETQKPKLITPVAVLNDDGSQSFSSQALGEM